MAKRITTPTTRVSVCALGAYLRRPCCFAPLRAPGQSPPKTARARPPDKRLDGCLGLRWGAKTIAQSHGTMRVAPAVQRAFGRTGCADLSPMARTLQACPAETVA
jgi:hypothetical protein